LWQVHTGSLPLLVPVEIRSPTMASPIEVVFPRGQPLGVRAGFDPATLAQLLAVLEELQPG